MDFYECFKWAVPKAFKDAISSCSFEEGDMLYNTQLAYNNWHSAVNNIEYIIQVQFPTRNTGKKTSEDFNVIFKSNWNLSVGVEITYNHLNGKKKSLVTTQGRLFTLLRTGEIDILNSETENPKPPLLLDSLKRELKNDSLINEIKQKIDISFPVHNLAIIAYDETNDLLVSKYKTIVKELSEHKPELIEVKLSELDSLKGLDFHPVLLIKVIAINSTAPERIRDAIKRILWPKKRSENATKSFSDVLSRGRSVAVNSFKLENHVIFLPYKPKKYKEIKVHPFDHTPIYRYRLHSNKINNEELVPKSLKNYLNLVLTDCPNYLFADSKLRVSKLDMKVNVSIRHHEKHHLIEVAKSSRQFDKFKSRHENLEQYFLENDQGTIAAELPLWFESGEITDFKEVFNSSLPLTGHIDILRIENDGKIAIWDYKPNAYKEKKAHAQVFLYAYMLSVRTGIKLNNFKCGYFDEVDVFEFNPSEAIVSDMSN